MKIAIYGAGSLGTVLGAYLAKAGVDVDLITRNREHVEALNRDGAKIIGTVNMTVPVHALTPDEMTEKYELIILLTKQLDNVNVLKNLQKNMTDDCIVCTLQNGLPELSVSEVVGEDRTMGCTVAWGATLHGKGVSELTSEPDSMSFGLGRMNGQKDDKLMQVKALLEKMKTILGERVKDVRVSTPLKNNPVCITTDGAIYIDIYNFIKYITGSEQKVKAEQIVELTTEHPVFEVLRRFENDEDKLKKYTEVLYDQALLIAGLPLDDPSGYTDLVCGLMK